MKTAVEWLHKESNELIIKFLDNEIDMIIFIELYHNNYCKAKEMEKEQKKCYHPLSERKYTSDTHFECTICGDNNY